MCKQEILFLKISRKVKEVESTGSLKIKKVKRNIKRTVEKL